MFVLMSNVHDEFVGFLFMVCLFVCVFLLVCLGFFVCFFFTFVLFIAIGHI